MSEKYAKATTSMTSPGDGDGDVDVLGNAPEASEHRITLRAASWLSWLFGLAMLAAVVIATIHFSEEEEFVRLAERVEPWWLGIAIALQVGTYLAQGETWRVVTRGAGVAVPAWTAFKLSLVQLFISQALPSGGISGTVVVAKALVQRGVPRSVVVASMVVEGVSYYGAYVLALFLALLVTMIESHVSAFILAAALCLGVFSIALSTATVAFSGRRSAMPSWLARIPLLGRMLSLLGEADPTLVRNLPLILKSVSFQLGIMLLDTSTVWILIRSLGEVASPTGVFTSFMASTLLRTISIVPGGLGVFEVTSVMTLQHAGVSLSASLAATLLFRGLSFWVPMLPGLFFSHRIKKAT